MKKTYKYYLLNIVTTCVVALFFSCKDNFKEVQKMGISENEPIGIAENINLIHTDSGKVKAILLSPKMLNYQNRDFPFFEFPNGITLDIFDDQNKKNVVVADYAINYSETKLIDLQGNVKITTSTNDTLYAEQLFYDQATEWLFTNKPVKFVKQGDVYFGNGFDSNSKFSNAQVLELTGTMTLDE
ncbi:LPS export ABC transporter periplasmic protein LptC [Gelatiniphilus marinus]|uniref:LPS export ABC transporter periplasmic protein LptC n=1 Tax=Gelatiniphilus marinus TaxID=1759464 RepID=A0ABW5JPK6_9FLAO